ncbi:MAG TPA: hypothetical protein VKB18_11760 [Gemmatimonadota bacterium]|nr:hypothetical protein [Gemmatimonadota bacterium]
MRRRSRARGAGPEVAWDGRPRRGAAARAAGPLLACAALAPAAAHAQDANILMPPPEFERRLAAGPIHIVQEQGSRFEDDRTQRATIRLADSTLVLVKFAAALPGADTFNNRPRYELAAYEIQKLFLDPGDYVVPPTVARCFPLEWYRQHLDPDVDPTFRGPTCVLSLVQYWVWNVRPAEPLDEDRWASDTVYARHLADFNVLTYLIRHQDSNLGNYLVSEMDDDLRVFSVDNGVAFSSEPGNRGHAWRRYRLDRIGAKTLERLRAITRADLERALAVVVQLREEGDSLVREPPGPSLNDGRGVRYEDGVVQLGLTGREIRDVASRLRDLLKDVDEGKIRAF